MNEADQAIIKSAKDALGLGKAVMVAVRGLNATLIIDIQSSSDETLVVMACPASVELGVGASHLTIRASDLLGVQVFT